AEDQHHNGHHNGGKGGANVSKVAHKEQRADGGGGDVHNVVADEDGGEDPVIVLSQLQRGCGTAAALFGSGLEAGFIEGGKGGFGGGEVGRHENQHCHDQYVPQTVTVHKKYVPSKQKWFSGM